MERRFGLRMSKIAIGMVAGLTLSLSGIGSPMALAADPEPDEIVDCDSGGPNDVLGSEVCFSSVSLTRGGTPLTLGTDYKLFYQDEYAANGDGSAGFVVRVGANDSGIDWFISPNDGDVLSATIAYPVIDRAAAEPTEGLRGTDVAAGLFGVVTASDFSFTHSLKTSGSDQWVEIQIDMTFVNNWNRNACQFGDFDPDTGFSEPSAECESPNDGGANDSEALVPNNISFYTPGTFADFVDSTTNGGYLNYQGSGLSWFTEPNNFQFQLVGPRYASGSDRNTGALQAFLPQAYMQDIFGETFDPSAPEWEATRADVTDSGLATQDLSSSVVTSSRNSGLLIQLASYEFSAPVFSFAPPTADSSSSSRSRSEEVGTAGIFLTLSSPASLRASVSELRFGAFAVKPNSPYVLSVRPTSNVAGTRILASGQTNSGGHLDLTTNFPALTAGSHTLVLTAYSAVGAQLILGNTVVVDSSGRITSVSPENLQPKIR